MLFNSYPFVLGFLPITIIGDFVIAPRVGAALQWCFDIGSRPSRR